VGIQTGFFSRDIIQSIQSGSQFAEEPSAKEEFQHPQ
jgi:hypothetical protein